MLRSNVNKLTSTITALEYLYMVWLLERLARRGTWGKHLGTHSWTQWAVAE